MLCIRGNNVFPAVIEEIVRGFGDVVEFRMIVDHRSALTELRIEVEPAAGADGKKLSLRLMEAIRDRLHFKPVVSMVVPGTLPRFDMKSRRLLYADS